MTVATTKSKTPPAIVQEVTNPKPPQRILIIGAAGGNEIQAALPYGVGQVDAVELAPAPAWFSKREERAAHIDSGRAAFALHCAKSVMVSGLQCYWL